MYKNQGRLKNTRLHHSSHSTRRCCGRVSSDHCLAGNRVEEGEKEWEKSGSNVPALKQLVETISSSYNPSAPHAIDLMVQSGTRLSFWELDSEVYHGTTIPQEQQKCEHLWGCRFLLQRYLYPGDSDLGFISSTNTDDGPRIDPIFEYGVRGTDKR